MMKFRKPISAVALLLLAATLLSSCSGSVSPAESDTETSPSAVVTTPDTPALTLPVTDSATDSATYSATDPETDPVTDPITDPETDPVTDSVTDSETDSETNPETDPETDPETTPPKEIVTFPNAELPNMGSYLTGLDNSIRLEFDFTETKFATIKSDNRFSIVSQGDFADSDRGYVSEHSAWRSIGFTQLIPAKPYIVEAELTVADKAEASYTHTGMVGIRCAAPTNLFIDGGVWFCFINDEVTVSVWGEMNYTVKGLPFRASDGIRFRAEETDGSAMIYANDMMIFRVAFGENALTVYDAEDTELGNCSMDKIYCKSDGCGYFRVMSHFADASFGSMKLTVEEKAGYAPGEDVYALRAGLPFGFRELAAHTASGGVELRRDILFADSSIVAGMFDFTHAADGDTRTLSRPGVTVVLTADADAIRVNDTAYDFTTTYRKDGAVMVDVMSFAAMMGYSYTYDTITDTYYFLAEPENLTEEKKQMFDERYDLYHDVVYNYDDVECDNTGVGAYESVAPEDRVVGLAYTTWHSPLVRWGIDTWGTPLTGGYVSNDREIIHRHGVMLAEAGVDFVYVDWSNNTDYDPVTMAANRVDFRTIEESTDALFEVWSQIPNAPKICFLLGPGHSGIGSVKNGNHQKKADQVWRDYVEKYPDQYFYYDGKPLVICYGATPTQYGANPTRVWEDDRYTIRWMTGYVGQQGQLFNAETLASRFYWSWEERGTQTYAIRNGKVECVTVSPATRQQGVEGGDGYIPAAGRQDGATFKKQFQRAMNLGSGMVLLISWNEWHIGEHPSPEVSRDLEPSVEHGTFYYDLMREQIKKYKGLIETED